MSNGATQGKCRLPMGVGRGQTAGRNFTHPNTQKTSHNSYVLATSDSSKIATPCSSDYYKTNDVNI